MATNTKERRWPGDLRYGQVEDSLARLYRVSDTDRGAFRARIRNLRKVGIPDLPKVGSGVQISYSRRHLIELLIGLELMQTGLDPLSIVTLLDATWRLPDVDRREAQLLTAGAAMYFAASPSRWGGPAGERQRVLSAFVPWDGIVKAMFGSSKPEQRMVVVPIGALLAELENLLNTG